MFTIKSGDDIWRGLAYNEMKLREAMYRGLEQNYTIIYPCGKQLYCEFKNDLEG